jgi:hypothetical protein
VARNNLAAAMKLTGDLRLFCRRVDRDYQPRADIVANAPDHFVSFGMSIAGKAQSKFVRNLVSNSIDAHATIRHFSDEALPRSVVVGNHCSEILDAPARRTPSFLAHVLGSIVAGPLGIRVNTRTLRQFRAP